jgi:hypothetical protein
MYLLGMNPGDLEKPFDNFKKQYFTR